MFEGRCQVNGRTRAGCGIPYHTPEPSTMQGPGGGPSGEAGRPEIWVTGEGETA